VTADVTAVGPDAALVERVRTRLAAARGSATPEAIAAAVRAEAGGVASDLDVLHALRVLRQELVGAGPLDELLRDPRTTDVLVRGPSSVWVDRGCGPQRTDLRFPDEAAVRRLAQRLALASGRRLDDASPYVDGFLAGAGVRLHAVLPPIAADGTCLSLRVLRPAAHDLAALRALGTVDATGEALLRAVLTARLAFLVSGGTGTGKTTILAALLSAVDPGERILVVEDAEELAPRHPHVVRLVARPANIEGAGGVALRDLVRQALRMRPDRLVVGEVRGAEACDLLAALNTGHDGGAGTVHANSPRELPARMEALAATGGLGRAALHSQLAAAVQVVLHMSRARSGERVLDAVGVLTRPADEVRVRPVWTRRDGWTGDRGLLGELLDERGAPLPWADPPPPGRVVGVAEARRSLAPGLALPPAAGTAAHPGTAHEAIPGTQPVLGAVEAP
jgi:pilus assembly protein CpaF